MAFQQQLEQAQKQVLTQAMIQSLHCLQMPSVELREFLQEAALSNPLLEVEDAPHDGPQPEAMEPTPATDVPIERREQLIWDESGSGADFTSCLSRPETFQEYLNAQLGQSATLDERMLFLCRYLVGCLNSAGYLDCELSELAKELNVPSAELEQALFAVQALDPPGVGARSLSECLLLQLAQGKDFSEVNIHLIRFGLPLLADNDYAGLARLLCVRPAEARRAGDVVRALNPIPSRGFSSERTAVMIAPEAVIRRSGGALVIEMNERLTPRISLNREYCALVGDPGCQEAQLYLKEKLAEAKNLMNNLENRHETLFRLLSAIVRNQEGYFLRREDLLPMTMGQISEQLSLNVSTVSRAVKDKYIQFDGRVIPLRVLFSAALPTGGSAEAARRQLRRFVAAESPDHPLSDEALAQALAGVGFTLSRRTVAKYRSELSIPPAAQRRRKA
ncbi:RNA polymerase sigma factor RpoN [Oscillibacter valericigenes Sjm18-20]|nr:RNA polymerase sigma factor RpoN [Oscillibacter valericigenes Sjm18-20]